LGEGLVCPERNIFKRHEQGLLDVTHDIQFPIIIRNEINGKGKKIHYFLNYSGEPQFFNYPFNKGVELVRNIQVHPQEELKIAPWDLLIIEE